MEDVRISLIAGKDSPVDVEASMWRRGEDVEVATPMSADENDCYLCVNVVQFPVGHGYYGKVVSEFLHEYELHYVTIFFDRKFLVA